MSQYIFYGKQKPEWTNVQFEVQNPPLAWSVSSPQLGNCEIGLFLSGADIAIRLSTEENRADLATLRNLAETVAIAIYDAVGYLTGTAITVELSSAYDVSTGSLHAFSPALAEPFRLSEDQPTFAVMRLAVESQVVRRILRDLHQALIVADDTAFYCFRAIETLAQSLVEVGQQNNRNAAWARLKQSLQIEHTCISKLESASQPSRHGKPHSHVTGTTRLKQIKLARQIVERYILFLLRGEQNLPPDEFPLLTG
jgi:hypothetical protein